MDRLIERLDFLRSEGKRKRKSKEELMKLLLETRIVVKLEKGTEIIRQETVKSHLKPLGDDLLKGIVTIPLRDVGDWWKLHNQDEDDSPIPSSMRWCYMIAKSANEPVWLKLKAEFVRAAYFVVPDDMLSIICSEWGIIAEVRNEIKEFLDAFIRDGEYGARGIELYDKDDVIRITSYVVYTKENVRSLLMNSRANTE